MELATARQRILERADAASYVEVEPTIDTEMAPDRSTLNAGATGTCNPTGCVTDSSGNVSFTYHDSNGPGTDTIKASFTDSNGSLQSATA